MAGHRNDERVGELIHRLDDAGHFGDARLDRRRIEQAVAHDRKALDTEEEVTGDDIVSGAWHGAVSTVRRPREGAPFSRGASEDTSLRAHAPSLTRCGVWARTVGGRATRKQSRARRCSARSSSACG